MKKNCMSTLDQFLNPVPTKWQQLSRTKNPVNYIPIILVCFVPILIILVVRSAIAGVKDAMRLLTGKPASLILTKSQVTTIGDSLKLLILRTMNSRQYYGRSGVSSVVTTPTSKYVSAFESGRAKERGLPHQGTTPCHCFWVPGDSDGT